MGAGKDQGRGATSSSSLHVDNGWAIPPSPDRGKEGLGSLSPWPVLQGVGQDCEFRHQAVGTDVAFSTYWRRHFSELSFLICTLGDTGPSAFTPHTLESNYMVSLLPPLL